MATQLRRMGISELDDQPWGTHFCLFYDTHEDLLDLLIAFFKAGLADHEFCLYVASEPISTEAAEQALRQAIPDFARYQSEGQIEIISHQSWYLAGGDFNPARVRQRWIDRLDQSLARGYAGMRFVANAFWLEKQDWQTFSEYEAQMDEAFRELRLLALCVYAMAQCSAADMLDVVQHHQFTIARRHGVWEHLEGSELARAHADIRRLNADLERQVADRTARLAAVNVRLTQEVAERGRSQEALRRSDDRLRLVIDTMPALVWGAQPDGAIDFINARHREFTGLSLDDVRGWRWTEVIHPEDRTALVERWRAAILAGEPLEAEARLRRAGGDYHWLLIRAMPLRDEAGQVVRWYGTKTDIQDRKQAEAALRQSEAELTEAQRVAHLGNWSLDIASNTVRWSAELYRIFDVEPSAFCGLYESFLSRVHPDDRTRVAQLNDVIRASGQPFEVEYRVTTRSGQLKHIREIGYAQQDSTGAVARLFGTAQDMTERKQTEDALRRSEDHLRRIIDTIPIMAWTVRPDGTVDYVNQRWMDYTGLSLEHYIAEPTRPIHPEDIPRGIENWLAATATGELYEQEMRLQGANGDYRWFLIRTEPLLDEAGKIVKWYGVSTDIDDRKRAEGEVNRQAARAETLARIAARLNKDLELEAVIHAVCEEAVNIFRVSQATMSLYDKKRDLLAYAGGVNMPPEYAATIEPITRARFEEYIRLLGPIMVVPDIQALPDVPNAEFSSQLDVRTVVTAAMVRDQELIGALVGGANGHVRQFANDELTLLKAVSDLAAQAIANAQLLKGANEQHTQLRALSAKLAEAQEADRRAIARELHDEIGQLLYALSANLEAIQISADATTQSRRLADSATLVDEAIRLVRDLALELRPSMLDDFGLLPALVWLVERQAQRAGYQAEFAAEPPDLRLPASLDTAVYRVVQIALTNVARHARARHVTISVRQQGSELELLIHDDGVGFDVAVALERAQQGATLGLPSMQERVRLAGGTLEINSGPVQGTTIRVRFPVDQPGSH